MERDVANFRARARMRASKDRDPTYYSCVYKTSGPRMRNDETENNNAVISFSLDRDASTIQLCTPVVRIYEDELCN